MIIYGGASKIGKSHFSTHLPNQDAYAITQSKKGFAVAVSDGLGSRKNSQQGSKAAVKSVVKAFKMLNSMADGTDIIRLVHAIWRIKLIGFDVWSCACTCLFVMRFSDGRLFAAAL